MRRIELMYRLEVNRIVPPNAMLSFRFFHQLTRAVSSGVLMSRIDYFKAALEGLSDPAHEDDAQYVLERLSRVENDIRRIA